MIRVILVDAGGSCVQGALELVDLWREKPGSRLWLDIEGELNADAQQLLESMGCDSLSVTDSLRTRHPPKVEFFERNTFILFRGIASLDDRLELEPQQIGMWVGDSLVITAHRGKSVSIDKFWDIESRPHLLEDPAVLCLRLIHFASGRYLEKLLDFEDHLTDLEDGLLTSQSEEGMKDLVSYRSRLRKLRRIFSYHKGLSETILLTSGPHLGAGEEGHAHLRRDVYDRCERLYSLSNMYYEMCGDLVEGHISLSSHNLNHTMKILTIISAIFVPLTFLAGIYGMNFENIPELGWKYAYFALLGLMAVIATTMFLWFRRIRWL